MELQKIAAEQQMQSLPYLTLSDMVRRTGRCTTPIIGVTHSECLLSIVPILDSKCTFCGSRPIISSFASRNAVQNIVTPILIVHFTTRETNFGFLQCQLDH